MGTLMCGGTPTPSDLAKVQEFSAALARPTRHLQQLAIMEMDAESPDYAAVLAAHRMDPEPWSVGDPRDGRSLRSDVEATGPVEWCEFDPRPEYCQHRECYP